jgi:tetratricopeptide (TPR) repeat protein
VLGGFKSASRAYDEHERVLALDPSRRDAGFIVGLYRYGVASLSAPMRLLAYLGGFGGGKARGLKLVEDAASEPSTVQTDARFTLIVMYSREKRFDDALAVIGQLQRRYPRNRLLWLEAAATSLRAGRSADARKAIETGLAMLASDRRQRAFGEEARWRYYEGATLVLLRDTAAADRALRAALASEAPVWLHGRAHKELGKLADLSGNRAGATAEYRAAQKMCRQGKDDECADEVRALLRRRTRCRQESTNNHSPSGRELCGRGLAPDSSVHARSRN